MAEMVNGTKNGTFGASVNRKRRLRSVRCVQSRSGATDDLRILCDFDGCAEFVPVLAFPSFGINAEKLFEVAMVPSPLSQALRMHFRSVQWDCGIPRSAELRGAG